MVCSLTMRRGLRARASPFVGLAMAVLVWPASSDAGVRRAGDVLPPGQSGHVSISGLTAGTGSPHLNDQVGLFVGFQFKPHTFGQPPGTVTPTPARSVEHPRAGIEIIRDAYGVPAVTGRTSEDVWFGAGYAVAQDRLFQLELFRRATRGRLAEILGKGYLADDLVARRDYYTGAELDAQLSRLPADLQARFSSYRDGINAWIASVKSDPDKMPGEFAAVGLPAGPAEWETRDLLAIGVFLARTLPAGNGEELNNARGLAAVGPKLFDRVIPLRFRGQVPTVPKTEGMFPSQPGRTRRQERAAFARSQRYLSELKLPTKEQEKAAPALLARAGGVGVRGGSNSWAIRSKGRRATLFNGPQLGYSIPELFVELELHGPGLDVRGVTAAGVPVIGIGHNGRVAWGFTASLSDDNDLYVEELVDEERYRYQGQVRDMDCREETFSFRPPPTDLLDPLSSLPEAGSRTVRICRTVHGPVQVRSGGRAFARRYAIWDRELETLEGLAALNAAKSIRDVDRAMDRVSWSETVMAADDRGHIGWWHPGLMPLRPLDWDERLPYPGTGEAEWRGFLAPDRRPQVIDPRSGFLSNWNNMPSYGWTNGDSPARERLGGRLHRAKFLSRQVRRATRLGGGYELTAEVDRRSGTLAQQRVLEAGSLRRANASARGEARAVLETILRWDGSYARTSQDGTVDPGVAAWDALMAAAKRVRLGRGEDVNLLGHTAGNTHRFEATSLESFSLRTLTPGDYQRAAAEAFDELAKRFGSRDPVRWRQPRLLFSPDAQGAAGASFPDFPYFDRGTWQQVVELGP